MLKKYEYIRIINLDKLTYAGNLENLKSIQDDPRHIFVHGDICDNELVNSLFEKYEIDYVAHFAAESHVDRSIREPEVFAKTNVEGTVNLLNCAKAAWENENEYEYEYEYEYGTWKEGVKFLHVSTDEVYGSLGETGYFMEATPLDPHRPYSSSKAESDLMLKAYNDTYKMPINIIRCSNNYRLFQFPEKLIPLLINNCLDHKDLPVYGDGMNIRYLLFVEDNAKAIDMVINNGKNRKVHNVGENNKRTNITTENLIKYVEDRKGHDRRYGIDSTKIKKELGCYNETTFEVGIKKTIQVHLDNQEYMKNVT